MLEFSSVILTALITLGASLGLLAAGYAGWQRGLLRRHLIGILTSVLIILGVFATTLSVDQSQGGGLRQILTGLIYLSAAAIFFWNNQGKFEPPWRLIPVTLSLMVLVTLASATWSVLPDVTIRRSMQLGGIVVFALAAVRSFESRTLWRHVSNAHALWVLLALLIMPLMPEFSFDGEGNFRGLASHKNSWAGIALVVALISVWRVKNTPGSGYTWVLLGISLFTILLTRSATALSMAGAAIVLYGAGTLFTSRSTAANGAALISIMALFTAPFLWLLIAGTSPLQVAADTYFDLVQKDATLTGRNELWQTILSHAWSTPWLGSGYGAFWVGESGPAVAVVAGLNWLPVHSHNGYIDLFNELGVLGCTVFALMILVHLSNILRLIYRGTADLALLHLTITAAVLGYNLAESSLLLATHSLWILLVISIVDAHRLVHLPTPYRTTT